MIRTKTWMITRGGSSGEGGFPHVLVKKRKEKQKAKQKKKLHDKEALKELTGNKYIFIYICPQLALWFHRGLMYNRPSVICPDP